MDFEDVPDPTLYAAPFFLASLVLERWLLARQQRAGRDVLGYVDRKDTWASLAMGVGSLLFVTLINWGVYALAGWLYAHRLLDLEGGGGAATATMWALALLGWDHQYYWHHRFEHEVRVLWACHVNHHSSEMYNLSTALRQPWTPWLSLVMYPPLSLFGAPPWLVLVSGGINLIYQFWTHTEAIGKLPRWFELVFNTPSHHRVHHGSNPAYLDKNYAGILIVWDRLYGTFEEERERVTYGLTKNIRSYNPFVIAFHEYAAIAKDVARARSLREGIGYVLGHPGWSPPE
jgi:sterol desaturase/sphingolipid hydroxylase (fatty acid hydroxylase superfamily)